MTKFTNIRHRNLVSVVAVALVLLGSSFGVAKSASAAAPERHAEVTSVRHHLAHLEIDSGEIRNPIETLNLATAAALPRRP